MSQSETIKWLAETEKRFNLFSQALTNLHTAIETEHSVKKKQAEAKKEEYYRQFQSAYRSQ